MAKRHSVMLASISLAALALSTAFAADVAITPAQSEPHVGPKHVAAPLTTTAATALDNSLIVMPIPPQPSPERVDAAAHETGNPINKPVAGATIEPEVVGGEKPLSVNRFGDAAGSWARRGRARTWPTGRPISGWARLRSARRPLGAGVCNQRNAAALREHA